MNEELENIFKDFKINNDSIPVSFMRYEGKKTTYITYMETNKNNSFGADDELQGYVDYYDVDIFSKKNYLEVIKQVKKIMKQNGWTWQPSMDSQDQYEDDTGYYHKTLCFAKEIQILEED